MSGRCDSCGFIGDVTCDDCGHTPGIEVADLRARLEAAEKRADVARLTQEREAARNELGRVIVEASLEPGESCAVPHLGAAVTLVCALRAERDAARTEVERLRGALEWAAVALEACSGAVLGAIRGMVAADAAKARAALGGT